MTTAAVVLFYVLRPLWRAEPCVRWQASSIEVVNGKITKPHVTQGCGAPGVTGNSQKGENK